MAKVSNRRFRQVADGILETAAQLFDEKGYGEVSLQDIADAVGMTRPSLYHYFASKDEMLATLVERTTSRREEIIASVKQLDGDPLARLRTLLRLTAEAASSNPAGLRLTLNNQGALPTEVRRRSVRSRRLLFDLLVGILSEGAAKGVLRPMHEHEMAATIVAALSGLQYRDIGGIAVAPEHFAELMEQLLVFGVRQPPEREASDMGQALELLRQDVLIIEQQARRLNGDGSRRRAARVD
jgi:AcrR family transcriptional regulator